MDGLFLSGLVIVIGFALFAVNMTVGPPRLYLEEDINVRLSIIDKFPTRWKIAQWAGGLASLVASIGFLLASLAMQDAAAVWMVFLAAGLLILGGIVMVIFAKEAQANPREYLESGLPKLTRVFCFSSAVGGILYGTAFLQSGLPSWLGWLMIIASVLLGYYPFTKNKSAYGFVVIFYITQLIVGIVLMGS